MDGDIGILNNTSVLVSLSPFLYLLAHSLVRRYIESGKKIETTEDLESIGVTESRRLGLENKIIFHLVHEGANSEVKFLRNGFYHINIEHGTPITTVSHELYHIFDGWIDRVLKTEKDFNSKDSILVRGLASLKMPFLVLEYLFYREWKAIFYELRRFEDLT